MWICSIFLYRFCVVSSMFVFASSCVSASRFFHFCRTLVISCSFGICWGSSSSLSDSDVIILCLRFRLVDCISSSLSELYTRFSCSVWSFPLCGSVSFCLCRFCVVVSVSVFVSACVHLSMFFRFCRVVVLSFSSSGCWDSSSSLSDSDVIILCLCLRLFVCISSSLSELFASLYCSDLQHGHRYSAFFTRHLLAFVYHIPDAYSVSRCHTQQVPLLLHILRIHHLYVL